MKHKMNLVKILFKLLPAASPDRSTQLVCHWYSCPLMSHYQNFPKHSPKVDFPRRGIGLKLSWNGQFR
jgi:hypothetical protein